MESGLMRKYTPTRQNKIDAKKEKKKGGHQRAHRFISRACCQETFIKRGKVHISHQI